MSGEFISIVMPVYNKEKYVAMILEDLSNQVFSDFECILIDDGSTDNTGEICDIFSKKDSRFLVYHIPNGGVSHARNVGMSKAKGKYLTFVDGDDRVHPNYLENLYHCIKKNNVDLVIGSIEKVWSNSDKTISIIPPYLGYRKMDDIMPSFARFQQDTGIFGICTAKLFRRSLVQNICFNESLCLAEDFDFYLNLYNLVNTIYFDDKPYYFYLQSAENSSVLTQDNEIDYVAQVHIMLHYREFLQSRKAYCAENKKIVEHRLSNYVFFALLHCKREKLKLRYLTLRKILLEENFSLCGKSLMQRWILFTLKSNLFIFTKSTFIIYDYLRCLVRREK